jgi:hypothetical protein
MTGCILLLKKELKSGKIIVVDSTKKDPKCELGIFLWHYFTKYSCIKRITAKRW